jgi:hypothetical protein
MNFESKTIEIRDRLTFIPALAMRVCGANGYLFARGGYGQEYCVILMRLSDCEAHYDPYDWEDRTHRVAHEWIEKNWQAIKDRDVADVEFILGETKKPKVSEGLENAHR